MSTEEQNRTAAPAPRGGRARRQPARRRQAARGGQDDRPRAHRRPPRQGLVRRDSTCSSATRPAASGSRTAAPPATPSSPAGAPSTAGPSSSSPRTSPSSAGSLGRGGQRQDLQGDGPGHADRRPARRPQGLRRRPHPGGGVRRSTATAQIFPRNVHGLGGDPPDLGDHGPVRRRRRLLAGHDRLRLPGGRAPATSSSPAPMSSRRSPAKR